MNHEERLPETPLGVTGGRSSLSTRAIVVVVVLVGFALATAIPAKQWIEQRDRIGILQNQLAATQAEVERLTAEAERWQDPAYVRARVRDRLFFVMPYEIGYIVIDTQRIEAIDQYVITQSQAPEVWYSTMFDSIKESAKTSAPTDEQ